MIHQDPSMRPSIEEIGCHPWMLQQFSDEMPLTVYMEMNERLNYLKQLTEAPSVDLSIDLESTL